MTACERWSHPKGPGAPSEWHNGLLEGGEDGQRRVLPRGQHGVRRPEDALEELRRRDDVRHIDHLAVLGGLGEGILRGHDT